MLLMGEVQPETEAGPGACNCPHPVLPPSALWRHVASRGEQGPGQIPRATSERAALLSAKQPIVSA